MKKTIALIDDSPSSRTMSSILLRRAGFMVYEASEGSGGLFLIRTLRPDLIVLDLMMPHVDGFQVANTLAQDPELADIPLLLLSALDQSEEVQSLLELGRRTYLPKINASQQLVEAVRALLA